MSIWNDLKAHRAATENVRIADLLKDSGRFDRFSANLDDMLLDFSKTSMDDTALDLLLKLADQTSVEAKRDAMFAGEKDQPDRGSRGSAHSAAQTRRFGYG